MENLYELKIDGKVVYQKSKKPIVKSINCVKNNKCSFLFLFMGVIVIFECLLSYFVVFLNGIIITI